MAKMLLTIQHNGTVFSPPVEDGVKIEWERTGAPGKLTFTTVKVTNGDMSFLEGDPVCFYYDDKPIFAGYVFKKKRDREHRIEVTCYDQIRYLKNKYTYVFENKTATQIIQSMCKDFNLELGEMDNTNYVIPAVAEENKSALDISLDTLEETLLNTGKLFVLYDSAGKLYLKSSENMVSETLIMENTAENFDYTSSIDDETYNNVVLYYTTDDNQTQIYTASSPSTIKKWGTLRYFEEVDTPTSGENKARNLLKLYNKKTRELKVTGAFGDVSVRGGTLIPTNLNLGDIFTKNYMLVEKVTHNFSNDHYTMDLTLQGYWEDDATDVVSATIGEIVEKQTSGSTGGSTGGSGNQSNGSPSSDVDVAAIKSEWDNAEKNPIKLGDKVIPTTKLVISSQGAKINAGKITITYYSNGEKKVKTVDKQIGDISVMPDYNTTVVVSVANRKKDSILTDAWGTINSFGTPGAFIISNFGGKGEWSIKETADESNERSADYSCKVLGVCGFTVRWTNTVASHDYGYSALSSGLYF